MNKVKNKKWEKEREKEREGELKIKIKMGEGEGEWERRIIIIKRMGKREGQCVRGRRKNFLVALAFVNHFATWNGGKSGRKKKCPLHFTLKKVKVSFLKFYKRNNKGEIEKNQKITFLWAGMGR
jgi:hypothetical protein